MTHSSSEQSTSKKTEEPVRVLSDEEKKAILVHYVRKIAKMIKKNKCFLDSDSRKVAMTMLFLEIRYRIDNWFKIPCIEGAPHEKLAALSGCLLRKLDNLNYVNPSLSKKADPVVPVQEPVVAKLVPSIPLKKELTREEKVVCLKRILANRCPIDSDQSTIAKAVNQIITECGLWLNLPGIDFKLSIESNYKLLIDFIRNQLLILDVLMAPYDGLVKTPSDDEQFTILRKVLLSLPDESSLDGMLLSGLASAKTSLETWMKFPTYNTAKSVEWNFEFYVGHLKVAFAEVEKKVVRKSISHSDVSLPVKFDVLVRVCLNLPLSDVCLDKMDSLMATAKDEVKGWLNFPENDPSKSTSENYEQFVKSIRQEKHTCKIAMIQHVLSEVGKYILEVTETRVFTGEQANKITDLLMRDLGFELIPICKNDEHDFARLSRLCEWLAKGYRHLKDSL